MSITVEDMRSKLLSINELYDKLAADEPISTRAFSVGDDVRFSGAADGTYGLAAKAPGETVPVFVDLGIGTARQRLQLTRDALEQACRTVGLRRDYVTTCPADLLIPHLNYWYRAGLHGTKKGSEFQFVVRDGATAVALAKQGFEPFSNLSLLETAVDRIRDNYGSVEVLADYKSHHSLKQTTTRLIIPGVGATLEDTGTPEDTWSFGIQVRNSLLGVCQTSIEGYLFRWVCTNGQIDAHATSGTYTRRKTADQDEVYLWAKAAVDDVLGGLEPALGAVQDLAAVGVEGSVSDTLRDVFAHHKIPIGLRPRIIRILEEYPGEITMYVIMNAITQVANEDGLDPSAIDSLLRVGGEFPYTAKDRCGACHRLMHSH